MFFYEDDREQLENLRQLGVSTETRLDLCIQSQDNTESMLKTLHDLIGQMNLTSLKIVELLTQLIEINNNPRPNFNDIFQSLPKEIAEKKHNTPIKSKTKAKKKDNSNG